MEGGGEPIVNGRTGVPDAAWIAVGAGLGLVLRSVIDCFAPVLLVDPSMRN